jgi:hypothetical protein
MVSNAHGRFTTLQVTHWTGSNQFDDAFTAFAADVHPTCPLCSNSARGDHLVTALAGNEEWVTWRQIGNDGRNPGGTVIPGMDAARCHSLDGAGTAFTRLEASP